MRKIWMAAGCAGAVLVAGLFAAPMVARAAGHAGDLAAVGSTAPNFTLPSQEDKPVSLADYKGKWVVLYFYPKDQTSGCTIEAHNFQRDLDKYHALNAVILGVSLDTVKDHQAWCAKDTFNFKLLADPKHEVVDLYGVPVKSFGPIHFAERTTFLISPQGKVVKEWVVKDVQAHSADVLAAIESMHAGQ